MSEVDEKIATDQGDKFSKSTFAIRVTAQILEKIDPNAYPGEVRLYSEYYLSAFNGNRNLA